MDLDALDLRELLELSPKGGVLRFAGQRALLLDAVAMGLLRGELIRTLGLAGVRGVLTRFGYAHGVRTAEAMKDAFPWEDERQWRVAGGRLHTLQGLVVVEPVQRAEPGAPFAEAFWHESYEAEQHLSFVGLSEEPVCWTLCGFASGYLSRVNGREIYCLEDRCVGRGDAACHMVGRERAEWGAELEGHLPYYQQGTLSSALQDITQALKRAEARLRSRRRALRSAETDEEVGLVARSRAMRQAVDVAKRAAKVDSTVLLTGPSGAGKERLARLLHERSSRAAGPFVALNCAAVSESLLESELFGHARGAFTGATHDRAGLFEAAHGGTLFLDEVGELASATQAKLLRVLQDLQVRRVGENKSRQVDVRLLAATNRSLAAEVAAGRFREDLFYRLRVIELKVPPLSARREDVLPLARQLLGELSSRLGREAKGLTPAAAQQLTRYEWPGNVRELRNALESALVLAQGARIDVGDLPEEVRGAGRAGGAGGSLESVEREHIFQVLERCGGNRQKAAAALGIGPATLYRKLRRYRRGAGRR